MATVMFGGERELNLFTAGEPHPSMLQFMKEQASVLGSYIQTTGSQFAQNVLTSYETYHSDGALRHARAALSKVKNYFQSDKISDLESMYDIQQAGLIMQRYVMSEPTLRQMYHNGQCNGYAGSYVDPFPGKIGDQDYNYRRVMNGMLQTTAPTEEQPDGGWKFEVYVEELFEGDRELDFHEQKAITNTWERLRYSLKHSLLDPSSPENDML
jgi:hypothetical protein